MLINKQQVAYALGIDERTVTRYQTRKDDPLPIKSKGVNRYAPSQYDLREIANWAADQAIKQEVIDGDHAFARLLKEKADNMKLRNGQLQRELAPVRFLAWILDRTDAGIVGVLRKIPSNIKSRVPKLTDPEVLIIQREVDRAIKVAINTKEKIPEALEAMERA